MGKVVVGGWSEGVSKIKCLQSHSVVRNVITQITAYTFIIEYSH